MLTQPLKEVYTSQATVMMASTVPVKYSVTLIKEKGLENIFLAVTCIHNGQNFGKKRFELISSAARKVTDMYTNVY